MMPLCLVRLQDQGVHPSPFVLPVVSWCCENSRFAASELWLTSRALVTNSPIGSQTAQLVHLVVTKNPDNVVTNSLCSGVLIIGFLLLSQTLWQFLKRKEGPFYIPAASAFPLWIMLLIPLTVVQRGGKALSSRCRVFRACELCYSRETLLSVPPVGEFREESLLGCGPSPTKLLALGRLPGSVAASF